MSAFIVDKKHIDFLVTAAYHYDLTFNLKGWVSARTADLDALGHALWQENLESVAYRYPEDTPNSRPGPVSDNIDLEVAMYRHTPCHGPSHAIQVLKALSCYEYQSCEHPGWKDSDAFNFCAGLKDRAISALPGYDDARWEVSATQA
jgi:hypothetical protein